MQNDINNKSNDIERIIIEAREKYADVNPELNKRLNAFLDEQNRLIKQISALERNLMNYFYENNMVKKNHNFDITTDDFFSIKFEEKNVEELIFLLNIGLHYKLITNISEEFIKKDFFTRLVKEIQLKTHENYVSNFLYSNLYDKLSDSDINKIFNDIKTNNKISNSIID